MNLAAIFSKFLTEHIDLVNYELAKFLPYLLL